MKNTVIVDASIVLKWVLDEPDSDTADALLTEWTDKGFIVLAPTLLAYEIANILHQNVRKGEITLDRVKEGLAEIALTGLVFDFSQDLSLSMRAVELANKYSLPAAYDAHYLALAERQGCELWTADTRMWRAVRGKLPWVRWMGDYISTDSDPLLN